MYAYKGFKLLKLDVARYILIESNQQKLELGNIEDNKESKYVNTIEKFKPSIAKSKRKTHHDAKVDYNNIINKSTGDALNGKSFGYKHRKSNKSVVFPPKKSSRKSLVFKAVLKDNDEKPTIKSSKKVSIKEPDDGYSKRKISTETQLSNSENGEKLDNYELNDLEYNMALKLDKRNCFDMYWSLLSREQIIIFTFFTKNDHNIFSLKVIRLIFLFCTDMTCNVFFFADETMHKMYLDYGKYNFIQQIAQIVFSTVATQMIEVFICFLSLTDKHYYEIKNLKNEEKYNMFSILKCVERKIIFFYIFTFLLFAFYWYAIACFCAVYQNTQMAFITDSISSFLLGLLYPFILYLFPSILRLIALKAQKASCIYSISDIIPFF